MRRLADSDAPASANAAGRLRRRGEPKIGMGQRVGAVEDAIDTERAAQPPGSAAQIAHRIDRAPLSHNRNSFERLQRTDEHARTRSVGFTG